MTSDLRLIETACIHCLYKPVFGSELGKSSSVAFNSQTTLLKLVFTDCWDLANPNIANVSHWPIDCASHTPVSKSLGCGTLRKPPLLTADVAGAHPLPTHHPMRIARDGSRSRLLLFAAKDDIGAHYA
jgi:hypothetical protein